MKCLFMCVFSLTLCETNRPDYWPIRVRTLPSGSARLDVLDLGH